MPGFLIEGSVRVAVTRPRARAAAACAELRAQGFVPVVRSLVRVEPAEESLASVLHAMTRDAERGSDTWLLFTSSEAVRALDAVRREQRLGWPAVRVACVGPATAAVAERAGLAVAVVPSHSDGAALAGALLAADRDTGTVGPPRLYWPRAEGATMSLKRALTAAGAAVTDTVAYRTLPDGRGALRLKRDIADGALGAVLFFSPSAVDAFVAIIGMPSPDLAVGVIGGTTGSRARQYGMTVHVEPDVHSITALAEALRRYAGSRSERSERES